MTTLLLLTLLSSAPPAEALRDVATENAEAKGKHEKSLEVIDKLIKTQAQCPKPKACPVCLVPEAALLDVRIEHLTLDGSHLFGIAQTWKVDPQPPEKLAESPFTVPVPTPPEEPAAQVKRGIPGWAWGVGGGVLGLAVGILVTR